VKKNRRGLGRGLGALIQSTVPEDFAESDESSSTGPEEAQPLGQTNPEAQPDRVDLTDTQTNDSGGTPAPVPEGTEPGAHEEPAEPGTGQQPADSGSQSEDIAGRYLASDAPAEAVHPTPREGRRPVDVFFPDRRVEPSSAVEDKKQTGRAASPANGRKRPTMPSLEPRTARTPRANDVTSRGPATDQPVLVEADLEAPPSAETQADRLESPAQSAFSGSAGTAELRSIPVADIHPNPRQPREVFDEDDMEELVASITEVGVLQPIVVRPVEGPSPYELVMGERRWRASQRAGMQTIPAIVRHTADTALLRDALLENLHRSQLNPLEEAAAYEQLLDDFDCTQDELSSRIGRSRPQISNTLRLLKLPPLVQRRVASGVLSAGHARALLGLVDPGEMEKLAQKIVAEGLSVRATEELVSLHDGIRQAKSKPRAPRTERHERLDYLANSLTDQLDTTVKITLGARKGKIAIDFASVEDLNRIMALINPSGAKEAKV
jgi:ParB family transcriptional regulator, chromosome partitioning protein